MTAASRDMREIVTECVKKRDAERSDLMRQHMAVDVVNIVMTLADEFPTIGERKMYEQTERKRLNNNNNRNYRVDNADRMGLLNRRIKNGWSRLDRFRNRRHLSTGSDENRLMSGHCPGTPPYRIYGPFSNRRPLQGFMGSHPLDQV